MRLTKRRAGPTAGGRDGKRQPEGPRYKLEEVILDAATEQTAATLNHINALADVVDKITLPNPEDLRKKLAAALGV